MGEELNVNVKIPFIHKFVYFNAGMINFFMAFAIWFLFRDNKKYNQQLKLIKNGALFSLVLDFVGLVLVFIRALLDA